MTIDATNERRTMTVDEAARELGIGRTLAFQLVREGRLPAIRLGRRILVLRSALERMLAGDPQFGGRPDAA